MIKRKSIFTDIINVSFSNLITLIGSIAIGIIVPMILGTKGYGQYRTFTLYNTYTSLLHCGFVDGVLLVHGGESYNDIDKIKFRSNSIIFIIFQFILSMILIITSIFVNNKFYSILFISLGINMFLINITTYYQFVSRATMRFNELSLRTSVQEILIIVCTLLYGLVCKIGIIHFANYAAYITIMLTIYFIIFMWYIYTYRDITFGRHDALKNGFIRVVRYCKIGIYITISYQVSNLILIIDNQFVSLFFNASIYGLYSFSYSMISTSVTTLSAVSTVLLPHMKQKSKKYILFKYPRMITYMMLLVYLCLAFYFPFCKIIKFVMPTYANSLLYFRIFLPGLALNCCVTMIIFNYYNVLNKSKLYFYLNLVALLCAAVIDLCIYVLFKDSLLLAFGSFISLLLWYMISEYFLVKLYHVKWLKNFIYMIIITIAFFIISSFNNIIICFGIYLIIYIIVSAVMFHNIIKNNFKRILNKV